MTSLDDLRATLDQHSTDLTGLVGHDDTAGRSAAIRGRVRVVRRRRRVGAAAGTAAVLATVAGIALMPGGGQQAVPEPATSVVGLTPPSTLSALDFDYGLTGGIDGEGRRVKVDLPSAQQPRLIVWATSGDDNRVTLDGPGLPQSLAYDVDDFSDWYFVDAGNPVDLTVSAQDGTPGVAVYTLGADPVGEMESGITFRGAPAGLELLSSNLGSAGRDGRGLTVPAAATSRGVSLFYGCAGGPANAWLEIEVAGVPAFSTGPGCEGTLPIDAASGSSIDYPTTPGDDATTRIYVTDGRDGPPIKDADILLSLGVYARTDDLNPNSPDARYPEFIEADGHRWERVSRLNAAGQSVLAATAPGGDRPLLAQLDFDVDEGAVRTTVGGRPSSSRFSAGMDASPTELVAPGETVEMTIRGALSATDRLAIGFYEQAD